MIYFLYGPDTFRSRQKLNEIIGEYKKVHSAGLNFTRVDGEEAKFDDIRQILEATSIFHEKKVVVIERICSNRSLSKLLVAYLAKEDLRRSKDTIVILWEGDLGEEKNAEHLATLQSISRSQEFPLLHGSLLRRWFLRRMKEKGISFRDDAIDHLLVSTKEDIWQLENELTKLKNYAKGRPITKSMVKAVVVPRDEARIFRTIDAFAEKNKAEALRCINLHILEGATETYLLHMIRYQVKNILLVKEFEDVTEGSMNRIRRYLPLHPFVLRKTYEQSKKFSLEELKNIYRKIHEADVDIKLGKRDPRLALEMLVLNLY